MSTSKGQGSLLALSGLFFAAFFIASLVLGDVARFYEGSRVAALASSSR